MSLNIKEMLVKMIKEGQVRRFTGLAIVSSSLLIVLAGYLPFFKTTSMMNISRCIADCMDLYD